MSDALAPAQLATLRVGVDRSVAEMVADDPEMGGRLTGRWGWEPGRYSFGSSPARTGSENTAPSARATSSRPHAVR